MGPLYPRIGPYDVSSLRPEVLEIIRAVLAVQDASGVAVCGNCKGTGKQSGELCRRCAGTGHDKHDPWCVGGEQDGICNCGADGVSVGDDKTACPSDADASQPPV